MGQCYGMSEGEIGKVLIVNTGNSVIAKIKDLSEDKQKFVAEYVYLLALSSFRTLTSEEVQKFAAANLMLLEAYSA